MCCHEPPALLSQTLGDLRIVPTISWIEKRKIWKPWWGRCVIVLLTRLRRFTCSTVICKKRLMDKQQKEFNPDLKSCKNMILNPKTTLREAWTLIPHSRTVSTFLQSSSAWPRPLQLAWYALCEPWIICIRWSSYDDIVYYVPLQLLAMCVCICPTNALYANVSWPSHDPRHVPLIGAFLVPFAVISNLFQLNVKYYCCLSTSTGSVKDQIASGLTCSVEEHLAAPSGNFSPVPQGPCKEKG